MHPPLHFVRSAILLGLALGLGTAGAQTAATADTVFTGTLSAAEQTAAGLAKLTATQRTALDAQIRREIALARQGDAVGFARTFSHRRTAGERQAAGLDQLTNEEIAQLDAAVARAVAQRPATSLAPRPTATGTAVALNRQPEVHGSVSFVYGRGSGGRDYYGGAFTTSYYDPESKVGIAVGYSQLRGDGLFHGDRRDGFGGCRGR